MQFLLDNIFLIAIAFISGGMLVWPFVRSRAAGPAVSTLQATQLINSRNALVIDVRTPEEFATGSLPGARNIPVDKFDQKMRDIKKDKPLIVVCASDSRAGRAAAQLRASGYAEVFVLAGGLAAWRAAGLPIRN
ncbi:MAG: rhodanese-like domain-containing protein [Betaproteobacteria bacterium]